MRKRWWWVTASGIALAALLLVTAWVRITDVGTPDDHYATVPDPCHLLSDQTVQQLLGETGYPESERSYFAQRPGLNRMPDVRFCGMDGQGAQAGFMLIFAYRFYSTQLHLGDSGEQRATDLFALEHGIARDVHEQDCTFERTGETGNACAVPTRFGIELYIQHENLYVSINVSRPLPDPVPEDLLAATADNVLTRLDGPAP